MFNLTHNNHYKYYIDNVLFGTRTSKYQQFTTDVGSVDIEYYNKNSYRNELLRVAKLQHIEYGKDMTLFVSGGTDSEIMARSFTDQGLKPKCIIIKFKGDYNLSEVAEAVEVVNELSLPYEIIEFDVKDYYLSGAADELAINIQCELLPFLVFFEVAKKISGASILGGELLVDKHYTSTKPTWGIRNLETYEAAHVRFSEKYNIPFIIEWFSYTPELMLYYLEDPSVKELVSTNNNYWSITPLKNQILRKLVPNLRIKSKSTGYENLSALLTESKQHLGSLMPENIGDSHPYLTYTEVVNKLKGNLV